MTASGMRRERHFGFEISEGDILPAKRANGAQASGRKVCARMVLAPVLVYLGLATNSTESAVANGDTRTINLSNSHTNESGSFTYMVNGSYDSSVLEKLNWFLRDWRLDEPTKMDPKLFDIVWEVYRESGSSQPIDVLSGYRSPQTNAMLRMRSRQVAEHSQHMMGRAMDAHFLDVSTSRIRDIGMRMQAGGVGFYPTGNTPWVHLDSGSVRYWPRISHDQMVRLFPDGKTVFVPSDGVPLAGYEQARAEIEARGGAVIATSDGSKASWGILGWLFGGNAGGADDAEEGAAPHAAPAKAAPALIASNADAIAKAKRNLPKGETYMKAPDTVVASNAPVAPVAPVAPPLASAPPAPDVNQADVSSPTDLHFVAPLPPRKPSDLYTTLALVEAPLPPVRPTEFADPQPMQAAPIQSSQNAGRNDLIAALLARGRLPGIITRGVSAPIPSNALALAEVANTPEPPERPAMLAKAAALSAPLPPVAPSRSATASRAIAPASKVVQAAKVDQGESSVTGSIALAKASGLSAPLASPGGRASAQAGALSTKPYGDLSADAFGAASAKPDKLAEAALYQMALRGSAN
jgi:uncharacterized protein YcbK (DUF882 family)